MEFRQILVKKMIRKRGSVFYLFFNLRLPQIFQVVQVVTSVYESILKYNLPIKLSMNTCHLSVHYLKNILTLYDAIIVISYADTLLLSFSSLIYSSSLVIFGVSKLVEKIQQIFPIQAFN